MVRRIPTTLEVPMSTFRRSAILLAFPIVLLGSASPALAKGGSGGGDGGDVRASGPCATGSWQLKAKLDDGRIEVEAEVDTNRVGQAWAWQLSDNGVRLASGYSKTVAPSGSFEVRRLTANRAGADVLRLTATRGATTSSGLVRLG